MKRELFRCNYCEVQRFDSETQTYIDLPFSCGTLAEWKQHISRPKHCVNVARNKTLEDDLVVECKHCNGIFTKAQYQQHKSINQLLWINTSPMYKDCSCNNFIFNNKRFENLITLRAYAENRYDNGRKKAKVIVKPKKIKSFADRAEPLKKLVEKKKDKEAKKKAEKAEKKNNIVMDIKPMKEKIIDSDEDIMNEFNKLNGIEDKNKNKLDITIEPVWDNDDWCNDCNKYTNEYKEYPKEKMKRWNIDLCLCGETDDEDGDSDFY